GLWCASLDAGRQRERRQQCPGDSIACVHGCFLLRGSRLESRGDPPGPRRLSVFESYSLTRPNAVLPGPPRVDLQDVLRRTAAATRLGIQGRHLLEDAHDGAICRDEQHVERNARVLHPETAKALVIP